MAIDLFPEVKSVVVLSLHIPDASVEVMQKEISNYSYNIFGYSYLNQELHYLAYRVARYLEDFGYLALPVPARGEHYWAKRKHHGPISFRHAAVAAGLGTFGLQGLVLTPEFGPRQRFIAVLTDAELVPDDVLDQDLDACKNCLVCVKSCPVGAININEEWKVVIDRKQFVYGTVDTDSCSWTASGFSDKVWKGAPFQPQIEVPRPSDLDARLMYDCRWHRRDPALINTEHGEGTFGASFCGRCLITCPLGQKAARNRRYNIQGHL
jgi:ferredoxin